MKIKDKKQWLEKYDKARTSHTRRSLLRLATAYMKEAHKEGVIFHMECDEETGVYYISIEGEEGETTATIDRLPTIVHGLFLMGRQVRQIYYALCRAKTTRRKRI